MNNPNIKQFIVQDKKGNWYFLEHYQGSSSGYIYYLNLQNKIAKEEDFFNSFSNLHALGNDYYWFSGNAHFDERDGGIGSASCFILKDYGKSTDEEFRADKFLFLEGIEEFAGASVLGVIYQEINGRDAFLVQLKSVSGVCYMAVVDFEGNVLVSPVKATITTYSKVNKEYIMHSVCAGLIIAQDQDTQLYGYMDMTGTWVIPAQYTNVTYFQGEGDSAIAIVNNNTIINRKGEVLYTINGN